MTRTLIAVIILLVAGLAGCLGEASEPTPAPPDQGGGEVAPGAPTTLTWGFSDCRWVVAAIPTQADALADHLPANFTPMTPEEMGLPPVPGSDAVMGLEGFECAQGQGLNGTVEGFVYSAYWSPVHPPDHHAREGAGLQFVKWDTVVDDTPLRERLATAGVPAVEGNVTIATFEQSPAGLVFDMSVTVGSETHTFQGSAGQEGDEGMKNFTAREFTSTEDGMVYWDTRVVSPNLVQGGGTVQLAPGSFPAEVVGQERAQAFFIAGTQASFTEASILLPS